MAASLLGLLLAAAPALAQQRFDPDGPSLSPNSSSAPGSQRVFPEPAASSPSSGISLSFHKTAGAPAKADSDRSFRFRKDVAGSSKSAAAQSSSAAAHVPDPFLALQAPKNEAAPKAKGGAEESLQYQIPLELPGPQKLFGQLDTETDLHERMRQEARNQNPDNRIVFPDEPKVSKETYKARSFPPAAEVAEPYYVCHRRLLFEEINSERYGWDLGAAQPLVSLGTFAFNLATVPYHLATRPCEKFECSAGYCLPGDPVPYLLYPPEFSATGAAGETAAAFALLALFP